MARRSGGKIVTDGLVLALDAANDKSYPGTGTTWTDLSGNGNNGTLVNGVGYNSGNGGSLTFDGSNDYVDFYAPNLTTTATVEMWAKISSYSGKMFMGWLFYNVYCPSGHIGYNTGASDCYGITNTTVTNLGIVNNWAHYVFEMRSDVPYTNNKIYINSGNQTLSQILASENSSNRNFNSGNGRIASWRWSSVYYLMNMNCASFKVYNRALTAEEISQNFNATRGRFGI